MGPPSAGGLTAVMQVLTPDLDLRQRAEERVTDPLGLREEGEFVLMRSEAQSDARR